MLYLIHFDTPYKHAKHYLGFVESEAGLERRLQQHASGTGARLMEVITEAGIGWTLAGTWHGGRREERRLKGRGKSRWCPVCKRARKEQRRPGK